MEENKNPNQIQKKISRIHEKPSNLNSNLKHIVMRHTKNRKTAAPVKHKQNTKKASPVKPLPISQENIDTTNIPPA